MRFHVYLSILLMLVSGEFTPVSADSGDFGQAMAMDSRGRVYVGGNFGGFQFSNATITASNIARWDPTALRWEALPGGGLVSGNAPFGEVTAMAAGPQKRFIYAGGVFNNVHTESGLTPITNFARYDTSTETWEALGMLTGGVGGIHDIDFSGNEVVVVGSFRQADGQDSFGIAYWNFSDSSFEPVVLPNIGDNFIELGKPGLETATQNSVGLRSVFTNPIGSLFVAGGFQERIFGPLPCTDFIGGSAVAHMANIENDGTVLPPCPLVGPQCVFGVSGVSNPHIAAIERFFPETFVGGQFTGIACGTTVPATNIAFINGAGALEPLDDSSMAGEGVSGGPPGFPGLFDVKVSALVDISFKDVLFVGGQFRSAESLTVNSIARWDHASRTWSALADVTASGVSSGTQIPGRINAMLYDDQFNRVYVTGFFGKAGDVDIGLNNTAPGIAYFQLESPTSASGEWFPLEHRPFSLDMLIDNNGALKGDGILERSPSSAQTVRVLEQGAPVSLDVIFRNTSTTETKTYPFFASTIAKKNWEVRTFLNGVEFDLFDVSQSPSTGLIPPGGSVTLTVQFTPLFDGLAQGSDPQGEAVLTIRGLEFGIDPSGFVPADTVSLIVQRDCNQNAIADVDEIAVDNALDQNSDTVIDSCEVFQDLDGNGINDIVDEALRNQPTFRGTQALTFPGIGVPQEAIAADVNGDGRDDITLVQRGPNATDSVTKALAATNGFGLQFPQEECIALPDTVVRALNRADFDCDGKLDLFKVEHQTGFNVFTLVVNPSGGGSTLRLNFDHPFVGGSGSLQAKDMNGDGKPDVIALLNAGNGVKQIQQFENLGLDAGNAWQGLDPKPPVEVQEEAGQPIEGIAFANFVTPPPGPTNVVAFTSDQTIGFFQDGAPFNLSQVFGPVSQLIAPPGNPPSDDIDAQFKTTRIVGNLRGAGPTDQVSLSQDGKTIHVESRNFNETVDNLLSAFRIELPFSDLTGFKCMKVELDDVNDTPGGGDALDDIVWSAFDPSGNPVFVIVTNLGVNAFGNHQGFVAGVPQNSIISLEELRERQGLASDDLRNAALTLTDGQATARSLLGNAGTNGGATADPMIVFADLNGDGRDDMVAINPETEQFIVSVNSRCPFTCGDLDGSAGPVNLLDFVPFEACMGSSVGASTACACADLNGDGSIDLRDFSSFALLFGATSTSAAPICP